MEELIFVILQYVVAQFYWGISFLLILMYFFFFPLASRSQFPAFNRGEISRAWCSDPCYL